MLKPLQIKAPQTRKAEKPCVNSPLQIKAPRGLYLEITLKYKIKQKNNGTVTQIFFLICLPTIS